MPNKNWFKIYRKIFDSDIWMQPIEMRLFIYLIGQARYKEKPNTKYKSKGIIIKRGQFLRSYRKLQEDLQYYENNALKEYSLSKIKRAVDKLKKQNRITTEKTQLGTLFTVLNYCQYQEVEDNNSEHGTDLEQTWNRLGTDLEQYSKKVVRKEKESKYANDISKIYEHWLKKCEEISKARLTKNLKEKLITKLKKWKVEKIITAIDHYSEMYYSDYYYTHNWTLYKFIEQGNGAPRFVEGLDQKYDGDLWKDYIEETGQTRKDILTKNMTPEEQEKYYKDKGYVV